MNYPRFDRRHGSPVVAATFDLGMFPFVAAKRLLAALSNRSMLVFVCVVVAMMWHMALPGGYGSRLYVIVDRVFSCGGPLIGLWWGIPSIRRIWRNREIGSVAELRGLRWAPTLLLTLPGSAFFEAVVISPFVIAQAPHRIIDYPTVVYVWQALAIPIAFVSLIASLIIAARPLSLALRARVVADGSMVMLGCLTAVWSFVLGPLLARVDIPTGQKLTVVAGLSVALVGCSCLLLMSATARERAATGVRNLLVFYVCAFTAEIVLVVVQMLDPGIYMATLPLLKGAYVMTGMFGGIVLQEWEHSLVGHARGWDNASDESPDPIVAAPVPIWRVFLPYAVVPATGILAAYVVLSSRIDVIRIGAVVGTVLLVTLVLLRQVFALLENRRLYRLVVAANARLAAMATTDPLTDLLNHRAMADRIDEEIERSRRFDASLALLFVDLDHFKGLNDAYGHQVGDMALRAAADVFRAGLRGVDVVGRWGGEEFVAVLPETDLDGGYFVAERLRLALEGKRLDGFPEIRLTASFGVACYPEQATTAIDLIALADIAAYTAKDQGRNQIRRADDPLVRANKRSANLGDLRVS